MYRQIATQIVMALNIRNSEAERLASELAALTGETKTEAVVKALSERLQQVRKRAKKKHLAGRLNEIARHCASLQVRDSTDDESLLYDERGLPGNGNRYFSSNVHSYE